MKTHAELIKITEEMQNKELVDALNKNFTELKESSEKRDQVMLNAIGKLEAKTSNLEIRMSKLENRMEKVEFSLNRIIDHLSGKKLLTEE
ncbi:MAG: hypothetical protein P1U44_13190 [Vicingaceae bacterium]|nr:hypothetical protein [Vicingaceae bacterium]